jgi:DNA uptake protein ComE-like DNA-binding protein
MEVDLATAPFDRLVLVPGIGAARARAILRDRREHGPVTSRRDLLRVPGIGPATVARLARTRAVGLLAGGRSLGDEDVSSGP